VVPGTFGRKMHHRKTEMNPPKLSLCHFESEHFDQSAIPKSLCCVIELGCGKIGDMLTMLNKSDVRS
jgi:hypothetical protein